MATQTVEQEMLTRTVEQYLEEERLALATQTVEQPRDRGVGFPSRVAEAVRREPFKLPFSGSIHHNSAFSDPALWLGRVKR